MEMDVKGVSQCPEPIPHPQGSGGCQQQQDGQAGESASAIDGNNPETRQAGEKEDRKGTALKSSGFH